MNLARPLLAAALALLSAAPGRAAGQPGEATPTAIEDGRRAYVEGTEAEKAGDCKTAIARFEVAAAVKESPAVRLRIGRCREKLGQLKAAMADYERARQLAESDPQARDVALQVAADLSNRVPRVRVQVVEPPADVVVTLDGAVMASDGAAELADPGHHVVAAKAAGREPFEASFDLAEGEVRAITISLAPTRPGAPPPTPPVAEKVETPFPWLPVALYGGAGVALGVGVPVLLTSLGADADIDARCFEANGQPSEDRDPCLREDGTEHSPQAQESIPASDRDAVNTQQLVGWLLIGAGTAAAGVATVLLLTGGEGPDGEARLESVIPVAGPGLAAIAVRGRF